MSPLPDPGLVAQCAAVARIHAEAVRARAARLGGTVETSEWAGPAARAFRAEARALVARLHSAARRLDDAADRLERHAVTLRVEEAAAERESQRLARLFHAGSDVIGGPR